MNEKPLSLVASIGLVLLCGAVAGAVALAELSTCFSQAGDSSPAGTKVASACASSSGEGIFNAGLIIGAIIAAIGVAAGYITGSRRTSIITVWVSLAIIAIVSVWGFATKDVITSIIGPV